MKKRYKFTVRCLRKYGTFPYDMLRYDCCYPATPEDVVNMDLVGMKDGPDSVTLVSEYPPTGARWASFKWQLGELTVLR